MNLCVGLCSLKLNAQWNTLGLEIIPKIVLGNCIFTKMWDPSSLLNPKGSYKSLLALLFPRFPPSFPSHFSTFSSHPSSPVLLLFCEVLCHIRASPWGMHRLLFLHIKTSPTGLHKILCYFICALECNC